MASSAHMPWNAASAPQTQKILQENVWKEKQPITKQFASYNVIASCNKLKY